MAGGSDEGWGGGELAPRQGDPIRGAALVRAPATGLLVTAILNFLVQLLFFVLILSIPSLMTFIKKAEEQEKNPNQREQFENLYKQLETASEAGATIYIQPILGLIVAVLMIVGAQKMRRLESFGLAVTASVLALIPYPLLLTCCCVGIPIGIWSLVVLFNQDVRAAFQSPPPSQSPSQPPGWPPGPGPGAP
jgi:hypothetical protein